MPSPQAAVRAQLARQVGHWSSAVEELGHLDRLAAPGAWRALERYLNTAVESAMRASLERLRRQCDVLKARLAAAETERELAGVQRELLAFRRRYFAVETMLDFYGDAINTRTNPEVAACLNACDWLARESLRMLLEPLGRATPPVLTYIDKGRGAAILRANLRLWDGRSLSPVAAVRLARHNLLRPTSLIHETGHQAAHLLDWVRELAAALEKGLGGGELGGLWAGWSLFGRRAGLICAALCAVNPFLTGYAQETRMYSLMLVLSLLATAAFLHVFAFGRRGWGGPLAAHPSDRPGHRKGPGERQRPDQSGGHGH